MKNQEYARDLRVALHPIIEARSYLMDALVPLPLGS